MNTIGLRLEYALALKSIKKGALAKEIGVHASTIDNYIKSKVSNPNSLILEKIANYLDISSDWLILNMGKIDDKRNRQVSIEDFESLSTEDKLYKIYALLLELKKGQSVLSEAIVSFTNND